MEKEVKNADLQAKEAEKKELDMDELEQVTGGGNPFAQFARVPNHDYDDTIRSKV